MRRIRLNKIKVGSCFATSEKQVYMIIVPALVSTSSSILAVNLRTGTYFEFEPNLLVTIIKVDIQVSSYSPAESH